MMINNPVSCEVLLADLEGALQQGLTKEMLLYNLNTQIPVNIKDALYSIFCAKKHDIALNTNRVESKHNITDVQQKRLDNLLMAEGITAVGLHSIFSTDAQTQFEYDHNFARLREYFYTESKHCDDACHHITNHVMHVLQPSMRREGGRVVSLANHAHLKTGKLDHMQKALAACLDQEQSLFRPISQQDYSTVLQSLNNKFAEIRTHLKLTTCQRALILRSRLMEGRRKRRNFPKETTRILNEYFYANYTQQYPTEEVKAVLARQCNMTIAQVSNWFGNKRIRHNKYKNTAKGQKEMEMYTGKQLPSTEFRHSKRS